MRVCMCVFLPGFECGGAEGGLKMAKQGRDKRVPRQAPSHPSHKRTHTSRGLQR